MTEKIPTPENINRDVLISRLTATDTSLEERISLTHELFPENHKREMLASADIDSKGRPVRYFRYMSYEELGAILNHAGSLLENPKTAEIFQKNSKNIIENLNHFLNDEKIFKLFESDFNILTKNVSLENYRKFIQCKLPRIKLFKLHLGFAGGHYSGITGLKSISVGAPFMPPCNPAETRPEDKEGLPAVEFSIPAKNVLAHPLFKLGVASEMEKEVNTIDLKPKWVIDIYNGTDDFAERFIKDPTSALNPQYEAKKAKDNYYYLSDGNIWDILQNWKREESIADLIPVNKMAEIDESNQDLQRPLLEK